MNSKKNRSVFPFLLILFSLLTVFFFSSCSKKQTVNQEANEQKNEELQEEFDLIIYSPHSTDKTEFIIREFRQRTGLKIKLVYEGTGELLERLADEEANESVCADVFWGGGIESLEANKYLFTPYNSPITAEVNSAYIDKEHYWTGFSVMTMVIIYNTILVPPEKVPVVWSDLLDPFYTNRIIMPDPPRSGSAFSILNAMLTTANSAEDWEFIRQLKTHIGENGLASSSSLVHPAVAEGSYFAGLTSEDVALAYISSGEPLAVVYPADGTIAVPDGVALVRNATHEENAKLFIDFVLSRDVQSIVSGRWFRRSVRNDIPLPTGAESFDNVNVMTYDVYAAAKKRARILQTWKGL